jgi:ATP-dependent DNA ligase
MTTLGILIKKKDNSSLYSWNEIIYTDAGYYTKYGYGVIKSDGSFEKTAEGLTTALKVTRAKNVGKSNETSQADQAYKEAVSAYTKKIKDGFYRHNQDTPVQRFEPMLCHAYKDDLFESHERFIMQPKLDGVRCLTKIEKGSISCSSRNDNPFPELTERISKLINYGKLETVILDGEIISPTNYLEDSISIVRGANKPMLYVLYDLYDPSRPDLPYTDRLAMLTSLVNFFNVAEIQLIESITDRFDTADHYLSMFISQNYEGLILRHADLVYQQGKRPPGLIKYKRVITDEYTILDVLDGKGNRAGLASSIRCVDNGNEFFAGINKDNDYCRNMLTHKNDFIGKAATIQYFDRTKYNVPKFAKFVSVRDYE